MRPQDADESRVETLTAALIYLAVQPDAAPVLRDICASLHGAWAPAEPSPADGAKLH